MSRRVIVPPIVVDVDGGKCTILELSSTKWIDEKTHYIVSAYCEYRGYRSPVFQLDVTSNDELIRKLKVELAKMKIMLVEGKSEVFSK